VSEGGSVPSTIAGLKSWSREAFACFVLLARRMLDDDRVMELESHDKVAGHISFP